MTAAPHHVLAGSARILVFFVVAILCAGADEPPGFRFSDLTAVPHLAPQYSKEEARASIEVVGPVKAPGLVPPLAGLTLMRAIERCDGFLKNADQRHVLILRNGAASRVDAKAIQAGKEADPFLFRGDVVTVRARMVD